MKSVLIVWLVLLAHSVTLGQQSSYVGQEMRNIKALSAEEVSDYLSGKGMGLAKAAELNGYPGPAHVLELAEQLHLTAEQRTRTEALFASMQSRASALGLALVNEERELDRLFATKAITGDLLDASTARIGSIQARIRAAHLQAHLAQAQILSSEQNARYALLRGYGGSGDGPSHGGGHKH